MGLATSLSGDDVKYNPISDIYWGDVKVLFNAGNIRKFRPLIWRYSFRVNSNMCCFNATIVNIGKNMYINLSGKYLVMMTFKK
jgi:hypothetical protein